MAEAGVLRRSAGRFWVVGRVTALTELSSPGRVWSTAFHIALPLWLTVLLWRGLYARQGVVAGVTLDQAVTYAVVAALLTYLRIANRSWVRDAMPQHVRLGTITYWFLWPLRPATYHAVRAAGDLGYALAWTLPAYLVCLLLGAVVPPADAALGGAAAVSILLGQVVAYLIGLLLDLVCFWTLLNEQVVRMVNFVSALLSGGFAPLWFFPSWFQALSSVLPFASVVNGPMSLYLGRVQGSAATAVLLEQVGWCVLLGAAGAVLWWRARGRIEVLGG